MSIIQIQEVFQGAPMAPGVTVSSVAVVVTDASGAVQNFTLNGTESTPWSISATVAAGAGTVVSTQTDSTGAVGAAVSQAYNTASGTVSLSLSGTTVTITTP